MEERITSMIPRYGKLNKIYTEIMSGGSFSFEKQQFISDFYREYGDTQPFETALISLMLEMDAAHFSILLNSLKREIESNISTYNTCKEFFDRLDTGYVCRQHESRFDWGIDRQMKVTNGYYRELMEANGSLEAVGFRNTTVRKKNCWKEGTNGANGNTTRRKPSWMNCTGRRSRQDGKPCNACKTVAGTFAGWAAHYWQSLKNT